MIEIKRDIYQEVIQAAQSYPIVTIIGPRQSGKTTLAKMSFPEKTYVSLEDPDIRRFASDDPRSFLDQYPNGAILDEVQRVPSILSYLQGIVDETETLGLFILTGSHQLTLQEEISQSLAGRTAILQILPFSLNELVQIQNTKSVDEQLYYGFYPRIYKHNIEPQRFYRDYVKTYLERDVKLLINIKDLDQFQRFLYLCASRNAQTIDYTAMANDLGMSRHTVKEWISILKASFIITTLPPYFENLGKRIIKSSKLYFNDPGLVCYLLGIRNAEQIHQHPLRGTLFETMVLNEISKLQFNRGEETPFYFYRDSNQLEVDLVFQHGVNLIAIEIKSSQTYNKNFIKNLIKFKALASNYDVNLYVVYTGVHEQQVKDVSFIHYKNLKRIVAD